MITVSYLVKSGGNWPLWPGLAEQPKLLDRRSHRRLHLSCCLVRQVMLKAPGFRTLTCLISIPSFGFIWIIRYSLHVGDQGLVRFILFISSDKHSCVGWTQANRSFEPVALGLMNQMTSAWQLFNKHQSERFHSTIDK